MKSFSKRIFRSLTASLLSLVLILLALGGGWWLHGALAAPAPPQIIGYQCLRLGGYTYINPLLLCDNNTVDASPILAPLQNKLNNLIASKVASHDIDSASIYFRDFSVNATTNINPDQKYYPASLNKIPTMIAAYKMAEKDPSVLQHQITVNSSSDTNAGIEIQPKVRLQVGQTYTVEEAIEKMIKYSDNNAFYALASYVDPTLFQQAFRDLKVPLREDSSQPEDYMTAKDFSYFLRVLVNATYIDRDLSEKAMELLGEVDFTDGLAKGLPAGTQVAHKFGIDTKTEGGKVTARELQDCGIVYAPNKRYLLCVMTRSTGSLANAEKAIQEISKTTYQEATNGYK
ncbi:MAG: serine hydrolase [bacterium]